jgi:hypothetical protein
MLIAGRNGRIQTRAAPGLRIWTEAPVLRLSSEFVPFVAVWSHGMRLSPEFADFAAAGGAEVL